MNLLQQFERETGIHPVFSFASTAQLTQQIENGAPFDLLAAADREHIDKLKIPNVGTSYKPGMINEDFNLYLKDVDRSLIRENLRLSYTERLRRLQRNVQAANKIRGESVFHRET